MNSALQTLVHLLDLEEIEQNIYRGQPEATQWTRIYGGHVAAQALVAAGRTVDGRRAHSLHAYFLRGGDPSIPIVYTVDPIRDGTSFTTRRVVAIQHGQAIFNMSVSFHKREPGFEHADPMPEVPEPESMPTWEEYLRQAGDSIPDEVKGWMEGERAIDFRSAPGKSMYEREPKPGPHYIWMRANGKLPEDPFLHQCIATYASDMSLLDSVVHRHVGALGFRSVMMASLDHALWFHREFRMDDWILNVQESPVAAGARGFARAVLFSREGQLVASVAQEGLIRRLTE